MADLELLDTDAIRRELKTRVLGQSIAYFQSLGSTNDVAKQLAEAGEADGAIVLSDYQRAGRGRMARTWVAPARTSVLMSILLRSNLRPEQIGRVMMAASLGACDAIQSETHLATQIKWPNDILVNGKKCAGILAESAMGANLTEYVILGLGLNVNFAAAFVAGIPQSATTIADELGRAFPRERLVVALAQEIERYYVRLCAGDTESLRVEWRARLVNLGKRVRADVGGRIAEGIAQDVDEDGALLLRRENGEVERLIAGDVTLQGG